MRKPVALASMLAVLALPAAAMGIDATPWNVDAPHTEVNFKVRHFFPPVTATFTDYEVELMFDQNLENTTVDRK